MKGSKTMNAKTIQEGTLIVAIDIGMISSYGYCAAADGRSTKTFRFDNTREGFDTFWSMILSSKTRFQCTEVVVGYESTGPYGEPLIHYLKEPNASPKGFGRSPTIAFPGAVKTLTPSVFDVMGVVMCVVSLCSYDAASVNRT